MVRVTGQLDAPLVDMGAVKQDFWERKTIVLPSLSRLNKSKGWRSWFTKTQSPKIVVRRLKSSQWEEIQTDFAAERTKLAKLTTKLREITEKINNFKPLSSDEKKIMLHANQLAQPMVYSMISKMTEEPKMVYEDVVILMETLDDYDRQTLIGLVNAMSSNKASALHALHQERSAELSKIKSEMGIQV